MLWPITSLNVHVQGRVTGGAIATRLIPVRILVPKVAITKGIPYRIAWGDEMAIKVSIVGVPGKFHSQGTCRDISEDPDGIIAALVIYAGGGYSYVVPALVQLKRGIEAVRICAITLKSQQ